MWPLACNALRLTLLTDMGHWGLVLVAQVGWEYVCSTSPSQRLPSWRHPPVPRTQSGYGRLRLSWDTQWFWGSGRSGLEAEGKERKEKERKVRQSEKSIISVSSPHSVEKRREEKKGEAARLRSLPPLLDHLLSFALLG